MTGTDPKLFADAHTHLSNPKFLEDAGVDLQDYLGQARLQGIERFVLAGTDAEDWKRQLDLKREFPDRFWVSLGLHPWWVMSMTASEVMVSLEQLESLVKGQDRGLIQGIGELGLDYGPKFKSLENPEQVAELQVTAFERQLNFALKNDYPLVLHIVDAHNEAIGILKKSLQQLGKKDCRGMVHGFSASFEVALEYIKLGLKISVGIGVFAKGFAKLKNTVKLIEPEYLLIETDGPGIYLGHKLDSTTLYKVADAVASIQGDGSKPAQWYLAQNWTTLKQWSK